jgi:hypothetical protein
MNTAALPELRRLIRGMKFKNLRQCLKVQEVDALMALLSAIVESSHVPSKAHYPDCCEPHTSA